MQLVTIVQEVLTKGELPMTLERHIYSLLSASNLNETEIDAIEHLLDAIRKGEVRSVPDRVISCNRKA